MDNHVTATKRPRLLSLCMVATAASVLMLAGCGDSADEEMPPAQQPESMEQGPATGTEADGAMTQEPVEPSSIEESSERASRSSTNDDAVVPQESMQPEEEASMDTVDDEPGFGEGTDPMPGANEENDDELTSGQ